MKQHPLFALLLSCLFVTMTATSCLRDKCTSTQTYTRFDPILQKAEAFRKGVVVESPRSLKKPGKIYVYGQYLFINERNEGIHVIDNSDPAAPKPVVFWNIIGNVDMAIRGNYLYADQYVDLLTIDISNIQLPTVVCTRKDAFGLNGFSSDGSYIVGYTPTEVTQEIDCSDSRSSQTWFAQEDIVFVNTGVVNTGLFDAGSSNFSNPQLAYSSDGSGGNVPAGLAGSYARFGLHQSYLYTLDNWLLRSWSLDDPSCPAAADSVYTSGNVETIFPWKDRLFLGSPTGLQIFNNSNPAHPVYETMFNHATGCDPVVCDNENAYVTIHGGTPCGGNFNQLDIVDIRNLPSAALNKSYDMKSPMGLAVTDRFLYICDDGLKIYDKTNPLDLDLKKHYRDIKTYDVIALNESLLMVIGDDGFYQFDVSNPENMKQLSHIVVEK